MGETTNQIVQHIRDTRNELGDNIVELEAKVRSAVDWRAQFDARPMTMIGLAFGGGVLISALLPSHRPPRRTFANQSHVPAEGDGYTNKMHDARQPWDSLKSALIGVATARVTEFVEELVPGFTQEFREAQRASRDSHPASETNGTSRRE